MFPWNSPKDVMPWVGLYVAVASLLITLALAADVLHGFWQRKFWFPCRYFTINAVTLTLIAVAMKLPVELITSDMPHSLDIDAKFCGLNFLLIIVANFLPSLALMNDKEILRNTVALGILIISVTSNFSVEYSTKTLNESIGFPIVEVPLLCFSFLWPYSLALTVSTSQKNLELKYQETYRLASDAQERIFSHEVLVEDVKRYWMMAETANHQLLIASSPICFASGVICSWIIPKPVYEIIAVRRVISYGEESDYRWSTHVIMVTQGIGMIIGSMAPIFRCFSALTFEFSRKQIMKHLNVFRVEKYWTQRLQDWKYIRVDSYFPGGHCKKFVHGVKNMALNLCIGLQITIVVVCKTVQVPIILVILFWRGLSCRNSEIKLKRRMLNDTFKTISGVVSEFEKQEPCNLLKLLQKSKGWEGVAQFDNDQVPPLHPEDTLNSWSLVAVTLTAIAMALPNIESRKVNYLLASMGEGLSFVSHIEEDLNLKGELIAHRVWTEVELQCKWLKIDLQNKARKGETSKDVLQWLGDEAVKMVIRSKQSNNQIGFKGHHKFIAAHSMYRISQTILLHCKGQDKWPSEEELFEKISTMIADILCACFTNLPRVITMKCYESAIEKKEESIMTAARLLGKAKNILSILQSRGLPNLNPDSLAYIEEWHALLKSQNATGSASSACLHPSSSNSSESFIITIA